jgi:hypothetical protein
MSESPQRIHHNVWLPGALVDRSTSLKWLNTDTSIRWLDMECGLPVLQTSRHLALIQCAKTGGPHRVGAAFGPVVLLNYTEGGICSSKTLRRRRLQKVQAFEPLGLSEPVPEPLSHSPRFGLPAKTPIHPSAHVMGISKLLRQRLSAPLACSIA